MKIPDAAIEAAAEAIDEHYTAVLPHECACGYWGEDEAEHRIRAAIEAAAPFIAGEAWEEGAEWAGAIRLDGSCGSPGQNPYRSNTDDE